MQESYDDLFEMAKEYDAICITTNGIVKSTGAAVMGAGVAKTCATLWPKTPHILGSHLTYSGRNIPFQLGYLKPTGEFWSYPHVEETSQHLCRIFSFPTKHHYKDPSDIALIKESCQHMVSFANVLKLDFIAMSRPGCGNGGLSWEDDVRPVIRKLLDDRFHVVERKGN